MFRVGAQITLQPYPPGDRSALEHATTATHFTKLTRRDVIEIGYSTVLGAGLAALTGGRSWGAEPAPAPRAKSVLFVFLFGGPSHLDTFDPKPEAPDEFRGEFRPIDTSVAGVRICEHLPRMAQRMQHWSLVRSMTCNPNFGDHRLAVHGLLGGIDELPPGAGLAASRRDWPSWCAGVEYTRRAGDGLPASVVLPGEVIDSGTGCTPPRTPDCWGPNSIPFRFAAILPIRNITSMTACGCRPV